MQVTSASHDSNILVSRCERSIRRTKEESEKSKGMDICHSWQGCPQSKLKQHELKLCHSPAVTYPACSARTSTTPLTC